MPVTQLPPAQETEQSARLPHLIYLALGSNLGNRAANLQAALNRLRAGGHLQVPDLSHLYETDPVGFADQPRFLNLALEARTDLAPLALLDYLKQVEASLGREPTFRNGPRLIDLDIIFYDDLFLQEERLQIPHPRLHERGFVLAPLAELCPQYTHPLLHRTVAELLTGLDLAQEGVVLAKDEPDLELPTPRFLFVTGRLAESWLDGFLADLAPQLGFEYRVAALGIDVAAFMTCRYIADHLPVGSGECEELDGVILPGFAGGDIGLVEKATGLRVVRGPTDLTEIEPFMIGLIERKSHRHGLEMEFSTPKYNTEQQLRQMQRRLTDGNIRIYADAERLYAFNNKVFGSATPDEKELRNLFRLFEIENPLHAFYLGREFSKAALCIKLGRHYRQDHEIE
jgi:2-amino-4-hydroxy-6-hydroxymethyldihydropteridine diphosphokinase